MCLRTIVLFIYISILTGQKTMGSSISDFAAFPNQMLPIKNNTLTSPMKTSLDQCAAECLSWTSGSGNIYMTPKNNITSLPCCAMEYVHSAGICILLRESVVTMSRDALESLRPAYGTTYYELKHSMLSLFDVITGHVLPNRADYSQMISNVSLDICADTCFRSRDEDCLSFAYNSKLSLCAISSAVDKESRSIMLAPDYDYYQYKGNWPCNVTLPWRYEPRIIASQGYPYTTNFTGSCDFRLLAPAGKQVRLHIISYFSNLTECMNDTSHGIYIYDGLSEKVPVLDHLCKKTDGVCPPSLKSSRGALLIRVNQKFHKLTTKLSYEYEDSDTCDGHRCKNGASCIPEIPLYVCKCMEGFSGKFCDINIDDCTSNPCFFDGKCIDGINGYTCLCRNGSSGQNCEKFIGECYTKPCINGTCIPTISGFKCSCAAGYTGERCEYDFNECYSSPCVHGTCTDLVVGYKCDCEHGFNGDNCDIDKNVAECDPLNCRFGACAVNVSGSFCQCFPGFTGQTCDINVNDCASSPCVYGHCIDHVNAYECECSQGFVGKHCDIYSVDPCRGNPCIYGYCSITNDGFTCVCFPGYTGRKCNRKLLPYDQKSCANGNCIYEGANYRCECDAIFTGPTCSSNVTLCNNATCINGMCIKNSTDKNGFTCECSSGFTGKRCDIGTTPCRNVNCNNGTCIRTAEGYICKCLAHYFGNHCESHPCLFINCSEHEICSVKENSPTCVCNPFSKGNNCRRFAATCNNTICRNGGTCHVTITDNVICDCPQHFTGRFCEIFLPGSHTSTSAQLNMKQNPIRIGTSTKPYDTTRYTTATHIYQTSPPEYGPEKRFTKLHTPSYPVFPSSPMIRYRSTTTSHSNINHITALETTPVLPTNVVPTNVVPANTLGPQTTHNFTKGLPLYPTTTGLQLLLPLSTETHIKNNNSSMSSTQMNPTSTVSMPPTHSTLFHSTSESQVTSNESHYTLTATNVLVTTTKGIFNINNINYRNSTFFETFTNFPKHNTTTIANENTPIATSGTVVVTSTISPGETILATTPTASTKQHSQLSTKDAWAHLTLPRTPPTSPSRCLHEPCHNLDPCTNISCVHGVCDLSGDEGSICICQENYSGLDCSVRLSDEDKNDVITVESAIIGALGVLLILVISVAIVMFYRHHRRGSIYISSSIFPRRDLRRSRDTTIKKRYSSRDIHSELRAGQRNYFNPAFVCSDVIDSSGKNESNIYSPDVTAGNRCSLPPSPASSASGNSRSTSSSRGQWYDVVEVPDDVVHTQKWISSPNFQSDKRVLVGSENKKKSSSSARNGLYRANKLEDIPTSVLTSDCQLTTSGKTTTSPSDIFVRQNDGSLALKLSDANQRRTSGEFQDLFEEIMEASDTFTFNKNVKRQTVHLIHGADTGKSEA